MSDLPNLPPRPPGFWGRAGGWLTLLVALGTVAAAMGYWRLENDAKSDRGGDDSWLQSEVDYLGQYRTRFEERIVPALDEALESAKDARSTDPGGLRFWAVDVAQPFNREFLTATTEVEARPALLLTFEWDDRIAEDFGERVDASESDALIELRGGDFGARLDAAVADAQPKLLDRLDSERAWYHFARWARWATLALAFVLFAAGWWVAIRTLHQMDREVAAWDAESERADLEWHHARSAHAVEGSP